MSEISKQVIEKQAEKQSAEAQKRAEERAKRIEDLVTAILKEASEKEYSLSDLAVALHEIDQRLHAVYFNHKVAEFYKPEVKELKVEEVAPENKPEEVKEAVAEASVEQEAQVAE